MKAIFFLLLIVPLQAYGQTESTIKVQGGIRDADTNEPIPYAHAWLQNRQIGVSANSEGRFLLILEKSLESESLVFSSMGYKSKILKIQDVLKNDIVMLNETTILLEEIIITDLDPKEVILSAIKESGNNYSQSPFQLKGFYRTSYNENNQYVRLFEASVTISDKGFARPQAYTVMVEQNRKSNDYRQFKWRQGGNVLSRYLKKDNIRNHRFFLDKKSTQDYHYELGGITEFDGDEIYHIKVSLKDSVDVSYKADVYLRSKDYGIVEVKDLTVIKKPKCYSLSNNLQMAFTGGSTQAKYVEIKGTLYLSYSSALSKHDVFDSTDVAKGTLDMDEELVIYELVTNESKITKKVKKQGDIYLEGYPYDENFWQSFNMPVDTELSRKVKQDLDKRENLEEQFKKNGRSPEKR